jgi:hypothetical protein
MHDRAGRLAARRSRVQDISDFGFRIYDDTEHSPSLNPKSEIPIPKLTPPDVALGCASRVPGAAFDRKQK